uniref:Granulins domain-containing protein n=1 Tax=Oreochromis aureus TaxID=47969 RepID=A0AAZ1X2Y5_OREAU
MTQHPVLMAIPAAGLTVMPTPADLSLLVFTKCLFVFFPGNNVPCDDTTSCPDGNTCCKTKDGSWGCCPLPEAVCCEDGSHCCPKQYKCDNSRTSCIKGEVVIPWYTKIPAITSDKVEPSSVQCEGANQCPEQTTCCKLFTGEWGCSSEL